MTAIIYEPVLHCLLGTPEIMVGQLTHILAMSRRPNLVIQVVRDTGYFPGRRGQFESASGPKITDTMVMWGVEDQTMAAPPLPSVAGAAGVRKCGRCRYRRAVRRAAPAARAGFRASATGSGGARVATATRDSAAATRPRAKPPSVGTTGRIRPHRDGRSVRLAAFL